MVDAKLISNYIYRNPSTISFTSLQISPRHLQFRTWKVNSKVLENSAKFQHQLDELLVSAFNNSQLEIERKKMASSTLSFPKMPLRKTSACFLSPPRNRETLSRMKLNERKLFIGYPDPPNLSSIKPRNLICTIKSPVTLGPFRAQNDNQTKHLLKLSSNNSSFDISINSGSVSDDKGNNGKLIKAPDFSKQIAR